MDKISTDLLAQIADLYKVPMGAYNIRENGKLVSRNTTANIDIVSKTDKSGIDIIIKPNTKNESVHIPVLLTQTGMNDLVYNDFYVGENCDVTIVAGCGIHNDGKEKSQHDGIHTFHIGKNAKVKYIEKHLGLGKAVDKVLNPTTVVYGKENSIFEMQTLQLGGVSFANRKTTAKLYENASLIINEKISTAKTDIAKTEFKVNLFGKNSKVNVVSRAVANDCSKQAFVSNIIGTNASFGHVECDGILLDKANISSTPKIEAKNLNAMLTHEASIGKISDEQITKLESLGLTRAEAEKEIISGFLK